MTVDDWVTFPRGACHDYGTRPSSSFLITIRGPFVMTVGHRFRCVVEGRFRFVFFSGDDIPSQDGLQAEGCIRIPGVVI
jgi:hypothetical protein